MIVYHRFVMVDPYRMVVVNVSLFFILIGGLFFYRYLFPRKKINLLFLLIILSFLPLISVFRKGVYESGDMSLHVKIAMSFFESLKQGILIPNWSEFGGQGYGTPTFIFMYLFPYYVISALHFVGLSFIAGIKTLIISTYILSGVFMFFWVKKEFGDKSAFIAGIFYLYTPYHLIDMHFRTDIAELITFMLLPVIFLQTKNTIEKFSFFSATLNSFLIFLLIISHQVISLSIFPFLILYALYLFFNKNKKNTKNLFLFVYSILLSLILSFFYWFPILMEKKYIYWEKTAQTSLPDFKEFLFSPWRYGFLFQGHKGELSFLIGYAQIIVLIIALVFLFKNKFLKKEKNCIIFFVFSFLIILYLMQSASRFFWNIIPIINNFQFSYRLLLLESFFISITAAITLVKIKNKQVVIIICFFVISSTILNWGNRKVIPNINDVSLKNDLFKEKFVFDTLLTPKWINLNSKTTKTSPKSKIEMLQGTAQITELPRKINKHEYLINAKTNIVVKENTSFFPGWTLLINNKSYKIDYQNKEYPGVITFKLNKGIYKAELIYTDTTVRKISKIVSFMTVSIIFLSIVLNKFRLFFPKFDLKPKRRRH